MLLLMVCILALAFSLLGTDILLYVHYYKHFFTDEGYLTFTLPVSRKKLLLSKMVSSVIYSGVHILLYVVGLLFFLLFSPPAQNGGFINLIAFEKLGQLIVNVWNIMGAWLIVYILEALLLLAVTIVSGFSLIYFCITFGAIIAKKAKILAAVGIYFGINVVISFVTQLFNGLSLSVFSSGLEQLVDRSNNYLAGALIILLFICMVSAWAYVLYGITLDRLEHRLNLT